MELFILFFFSSEAQQSGGTWLDDAADLLRLDRQALGSALVHREVRVRGQEKTFANLDIHAASDSRHALCKFVYGRMFDWLVERINLSMIKSTGKAVNTNGGGKLLYFLKCFVFGETLP